MARSTPALLTTFGILNILMALLPMCASGVGVVMSVGDRDDEDEDEDFD